MCAQYRILKFCCNHSTESVTILFNATNSPHTGMPGKQKIIDVFTAGESVRQTWHQALLHVSHALYPGIGRARIPI